MEAQKHIIVSSESIYKFKFLEIILLICESLLGDKVSFFVTRRNFCKSNDEVKSNNPSFEYNFF